MSAIKCQLIAAHPSAGLRVTAKSKRRNLASQPDTPVTTVASGDTIVVALIDAVSVVLVLMVLVLLWL